MLVQNKTLKRFRNRYFYKFYFCTYHCFREKKSKTKVIKFIPSNRLRITVAYRELFLYFYVAFIKNSSNSFSYEPDFSIFNNIKRHLFTFTYFEIEFIDFMIHVILIYKLNVFLQ